MRPQLGLLALNIPKLFKSKVMKKTRRHPIKDI